MEPIQIKTRLSWQIYVYMSNIKYTENSFICSEVETWIGGLTDYYAPSMVLRRVTYQVLW
jgi:hypothetical protein